MAKIFVKWLSYMGNGFAMLEMTEEFHTRLIYVGNDVHVCEIA